MGGVAIIGDYTLFIMLRVWHFALFRVTELGFCVDDYSRATVYEVDYKQYQ